MSKRLSVASVVLAGNAFIVADALLMKTEMAMHAALSLSGVRVQSIEYKVGKVLNVNGRDVLAQVSRALGILRQRGDATAFSSHLSKLAEEVHGAPQGSTPAGGSGEELEL
eukprot:UN3882